MYKIYSLLIISSILISCGGGDSTNSDNTESALVGTWKTQECVAFVSSTWLKGTFEFTSEGAILVGNEKFSDADCISNIGEEVPPEVPFDWPTITFEDTGNVLLQEGIDGAGLKITFSSIINT